MIPSEHLPVPLEPSELRALGFRWRQACSSCGRGTLAPGACPHCGGALLVPEETGFPEPARWESGAPGVPATLRQEPGASGLLTLLLGLAWIDPEVLLPLGWMLVAYAAGLLGRAWWRSLPRGMPPRLTLGETAHEFRLGGPEDSARLSILLDLELWDLRPRERFWLVVRVAGSDWLYLPGETPEVAGEGGEYRWFRELSCDSEGRFRDELLELEVPLGPVELPEDVSTLALTAEVVLRTQHHRVPLCELQRTFAAAPVQGRQGVVVVGVEAADPGEIRILTGSLIPARPDPEASCPVCGDLLGGEVLVTCPGCGIPAHAECWQFNGGCATYGCRGG